MSRTIYTKAHKQLVAKIIKARKQAGLKQEEAARKLRRSQSYISKIEIGQRRIDIVQLKEFAALYNKKLDYFIE